MDQPSGWDSLASSVAPSKWLIAFCTASLESWKWLDESRLPTESGQPIEEPAGGSTGECDGIPDNFQRLSSDPSATFLGRGAVPLALTKAARKMGFLHRGNLTLLGLSGMAGFAAATSASAALAALSDAAAEPQKEALKQDLQMGSDSLRIPSRDESFMDPFSLSPFEEEEEGLDQLLGDDLGDISSACIAVNRLALTNATSAAEAMAAAAASATSATSATLSSPASGPAAAAAAAAAATVIVEPKTKAQFPLLLCPEDTSEPCQLLAGVGVRTKIIARIKSIKVYAFGLYVSPVRLKKLLGEKYGGEVPEDLKHRDAFYHDLLSQEVGMTVRLVVHYRGLRMDMVKNAFESSLRNRLTKLKGSPEDEGLGQFVRFFSQPADISRGTTIDFSWIPGGKLGTQISGKKMEMIESPHLCRAFFDLYIGDPPVCIQAKKEIGENFARMLSSC